MKKQSLNLSLSIVLLFTFSQAAFSANLNGAIAKYDADLSDLAKRTELFARDYAPHIEGKLRAGENSSLSPFYNAYVDKKLGAEGQSIEDFKKTNAFEIGQLSRSNDLLKDLSPSENQALSMEEAKKLLNSSSTIGTKYFDMLLGPCFLRSSHIVHVLNSKFPAVPAIKIWLFGSMYNRTNKKIAWNYHTAPAIPVRVDGKVQWMIFDTLRVNRGPISFEEWVKETHKESRFTSAVKMKFSAADRIGPYYAITLKSWQHQKGGGTYVKALIDADRADE